MMRRKKMSEDTKMICVSATMSHGLTCHVVVPKYWDDEKCSIYAREHLDGGDFVEDKYSGDWNTYDWYTLDDGEAHAVREVVAHGGDATIVDADPTAFDEDLMDVEFEDDDKWCIKFKIFLGEHEFYEYSWVTHKTNRTATDEDLIKEVYGSVEELEYGVKLQHREPMNDGEYNALKLMGVLY